jgi:Tfp pilus assembly protein PilF
MRHLAALLSALSLPLLLSLAGCSAPRLSAPPPDLFHDAAFAPPRALLDTDAIFALTPAMKAYARRVAQHKGGEEARHALFDALYRRDGLQLDYDAGRTRTAAEAFDARQGNCLSLVIMTAALAAEINVPVVLQNVPGNDAWSRSGDLYLNSGHVNLLLGQGNASWSGGIDHYLLVDFLPPVTGRHSPAQPINRRTVAAMFMNNRAAEALADGDIDQAYWWARSAIATSPTLPHAYNTLAIVYQRHGDLAPAENALRHVLRAEPDNPLMLANLVRLLDQQGRAGEAAPLKVRLAALQPYQPFHFYELGMAALSAGDYAGARRLFERELQRDPDYHEFHRAAALAALALGDMEAGEKHLGRALAASNSRGERDLYTAKLDRLRAPAH